MKSEGCEMAYRTAEFWASRVEYNTTDKLYEIIGKFSDKIHCLVEIDVILIYCEQFYYFIIVSTIAGLR